MEPAAEVPFGRSATEPLLRPSTPNGKAMKARCRSISSETTAKRPQELRRTKTAFSPSLFQGILSRPPAPRLGLFRNAAEYTSLRPSTDERPEEGAPAETFFTRDNVYCRYLVLALACVLVVGGPHEYDVVGAVEEPLRSRLGLSDSEFALLYSVYSLPNIVLVFFAGILLDRMGVRLSTLLFAGLVFIGSILVASGAYLSSFATVLFGRVVFAMGAESIYVAQNSIIANWFEDRGLSLAMGLGTSAMRLGTYVAFATSGPLFSYGSVIYPLAFATLTCGLSFIAAIAYWWIEEHSVSSRHASLPPSDPVHPSSVFSLPISYWLLSSISVLVMSALYPFQGFSTRYLHARLGINLIDAGQITSILSVSAIVLAPFLGAAVDYVGTYGVWLSVPTMLLSGCFALVALTEISPWILYTCIGVVYTAIFAALWPAMTEVVPSNNLGAAFGLNSAFINGGLLLSYTVVGALDDITEIPGDAGLYYTALVGMASIGSFMWIYVQYRTCKENVTPPNEKSNEKPALPA
mmetsp:Transcript_19072/g.31239  ORF Transcript_19072/g.31239 Transcript_19072/m.31239 type:complete len:522 (-) Transcript_19072:1790-3355(-)